LTFVSSTYRWQGFGCRANRPTGHLGQVFCYRRYQGKDKRAAQHPGCFFFWPFHKLHPLAVHQSRRPPHVLSTARPSSSQGLTEEQPKSCRRNVYRDGSEPQCRVDDVRLASFRMPARDLFLFSEAESLDRSATVMGTLSNNLRARAFTTSHHHAGSVRVATGKTTGAPQVCAPREAMRRWQGSGGDDRICGNHAVCFGDELDRFRATA